jgi:hypothetical protein
MADGAVWVQSCAAADFDAGTMTCAAPIWTPQQSVFPALTVAEGEQIASAILLLWATAWVLRRIRKAVD